MPDQSLHLAGRSRQTPVFLFVAFVVGGLSLLLDQPIAVIKEGPHPVSVILGWILPLLISITWGWRAGLAAGLLGGQFCWLLWPNNGWANVAVATVSVLWFPWHGWSAERRAAGGGWWWNPYLAELSFRAVYVLVLLVGYPVLLAMNPAPWAEHAPTAIDPGVLRLIALKTTLNGLLAIAICDALRHLAWLRQPLGLPYVPERRHHALVLGLALAACILIAAFDSLAHMLYQPGISFWSTLFGLDSPQEKLERLIVLVAALFGGLAVSHHFAHRLRAERLTLAEREELRITLDSIGDAVIATDTEGCVTRMNPVAENLTGWSKSAAAGRLLTEVFVIRSEIDGSTVESPVARVLRDGQVVGLANHTELVARDGTVRPIADSGAPIRTAAGRIDGVVLVFRDQSEERTAERRLRESEARTRSLIEASPMGIHLWRVEADGRLIFEGANPAGDRLTGIDSAALVGRPVETAFPALVGTPVPDIYRRIAREGGTWATENMSYADGQITGAFDVRAFQIAPGRMAAVFLEITERKRLEAERDSFFNLTPDLLCIAGFDGRMIQVNPAWTSTLGWSREELLARPWLDFVHADDRAATVAVGKELIAGRVVRNFVNRYTCKDGSWKWLSWNSFPLAGQGRIFAAVRDISEQRLLEDELRQAQKMEAVGQLAGGVAHDFNNMLAAILGNAELLLRRAEGNPEMAGPAKVIVEATERAAGLTGRLLAFARKGHRPKALIDVHQAIAAAVDLLRPGLDRRIDLRLDLAATLATVEGDATQIQHVILNLGLNARDAMPDGGVLTISTCDDELSEGNPLSAVFPLPPGSCLRISVCDTGPGMSAEVKARAFEPFFTTKEPGKGTGLGLSLAYATAIDHAGAIAIVSEPGQGARIDLRLPVQAGQVAVPNPIALSAAPRSGLTILVADDEPDLRHLVEEGLTDLGYQVRCAVDGHEAVEIFRRDHADLAAVILDMVMPRLNGREALAAMRGIDPHVPIVLCSGYSEPLGDGSSGPAPDAFVAKPYRFTELAATLAKLSTTRR